MTVALTKPSGLMVFCETDNCNLLKNISFELVSEGLRIASITKDKVIAVIISDTIPDLSALMESGVDEIVTVKRTLSSFFNIESDTDTASEIIVHYNPSIVFFGATDRGRVLAPKVAARLKCGITADCTGFSINEGGRLVQIRPALGGNILAHIISPSANPQMASVRPSVFKASFSLSNGKKAEITQWNSAGSKREVLIKEALNLEVNACDRIEDSKIVIALGVGAVKSKPEIELFDVFAKSIGGILACSRKLVEAGLMPHSRQVGQSGKTISPEIYIAVGISGAPQHVAGMKTSSKIIAVNSDRNAEIFSIADTGFVMDAQEWLKMVVK